MAQIRKKKAAKANKMPESQAEQPAPPPLKMPSFSDPWRTWTPEMMLQFALGEVAVRYPAATPRPLSVKLED
jgi:hypothetical protein